MNRQARRRQARLGRGSGSPATGPILAEALQHHQRGALDRAAPLYAQVIQAEPTNAAALQGLGLCAHASGEPRRGADLITAAIRQNPGDAVHHVNLGTCLRAAGDVGGAIVAFDRAIGLKPRFAAALHNKGLALLDQGRADEAAEVLGNALDAAPDDAETLEALASALRLSSRLTDALEYARRAVRAAPASPFAFNTLGAIHTDRGEPEPALAAFQQACDLKPDLAEALFNTGRALSDLQRLAEARAVFEGVLERTPGAVPPRLALVNIAARLGGPDRAVPMLRDLMAQHPDDPAIHSSLIFYLGFLPSVSTEEEQRERRRWAARHASGAPAFTSHGNDPDPDRRLRIGYLSADFRRHAAAFVFGGVVKGHDRSGVDVICYANSTEADRVTEGFRAAATAWRNVSALTDDQLAHLIRHDGIDILVDLSGHSEGNRLKVLARKPAPIQVSAWGHAVGTGISAIDYLFSDPIVVPAAERRSFVETVVDLPGAQPYAPPDDLPPVSALPAASRGYVTFGSLARSVKLSDAVLDAWGRIVAGVPGARLILKDKVFESEERRACVLARLADAGLPGDRVSLRGGSSHVDHLATLADVDIALDPFPLGGSVTTLEALWMGVPVVTLRGNKIQQRFGQSILQTLGLDAFLADTADEYIDVARGWAGRLGDLQALRMGLRQRLATSPIGDMESYTAAVETAYRRMWRTWCAGVAGRRQAIGGGGDVEARLTAARDRLRQGNLGQAAGLYEAILADHPDTAVALINLAAIRVELGRDAEAEAMLRRAVAIEAAPAVAFGNLGALLARRGRMAEAEPFLAEALERNPDDAATLANLAKLSGERGRLDQAEALARRAVEVAPADARGHLALAEALRRSGNLPDATVAARVAVDRAPGSADARIDLGTLLIDLGRPAEALEAFEQALLIDPDNPLAASNRVFAMAFDPAADTATVATACRAFGSIVARRQSPPQAAHANPADPDRPLRIGYVSPDFRRHAAANVFGGVLLNHDRNAFEVVCYAEGATADDMTARLQGAAHQWRETRGLSDAELAERVRADGIDILVDLAGHTMGNRLTAFGLKPAPVQMSGWGHPVGTGLATVDYLLSDPITLPAAERPGFAETVLDLPCAQAYLPPDDAPPVDDLPAERRGAVTFGCLNRLNKITDAVLAAWAPLVTASPGARLLLKDGLLDDDAHRARVLGVLTGCGVPEDRIVLRGRSSHVDHLATYGEVDIALDPFPLGGGVTTFEALWMGVPVVSLRGRTIQGRVSASILTSLGLASWVADDLATYARIAERQASDLDAVASLRNDLRRRFLASPVGDLAAYTRSVEAVYRAAWQRWCASR